MSQKYIENIVRELQKTLCGKIEDLESKINDQNRIIENQNQLILELKTAVEGKSLTTAQKLTTASVTATSSEAPQRPIRQARLVKLTAKQKTNQSASSITTATDVTPTTPEVTRLEVNNAANNVPISKGATAKAPKNDKTKQIKSHETSEGIIEIPNTDNEAGWQTVNRKKKPKCKVSIGVGKEDANLQTVERIRWMTAWSFRPDTTAENIRKHLNKLEKSEDYQVEKREIKSQRHAAFLVGCSESVFEKIYTPTAWPTGVMISEWFRRRPRVERGKPVVDCNDAQAPSAAVTPVRH